jgi:hypothetical protein
MIYAPCRNSKLSTAPRPGHPGRAGAQARAGAGKPPAMIQCHRCGGREVIEAKVGMVMKNGRASGGTKSILCATCHRNGERVVLA